MPTSYAGERLADPPRRAQRPIGRCVLPYGPGSPKALPRLTAGTDLALVISNGETDRRRQREVQMNEGRKSWASESFLTRDEYLYLLHTHTVDGTLVSHDADPRTGVYSVTYNLDVAK